MTKIILGFLIPIISLISSASLFMTNHFISGTVFLIISIMTIPRWR